MTALAVRWRVVLCPRGTAAVLSDREPGPAVGARGSLGGWRELSTPPLWTSYDEACKSARALNLERRRRGGGL